MDFGWCYFKKGMVTNRGHNHYLPESTIPKTTWKSLCGQWVVLIHEKKFIHFVDKSKLRQRKVCNSCERIKKQLEEKEIG